MIHAGHYTNAEYILLSLTTLRPKRDREIMLIPPVQ